MLASITGLRGPGPGGSDIDVVILKKRGSAEGENSQVLACGDLAAFTAGQPAKTCCFLVDGYNGAVADFSLAIDFAAGLAVSPPAPLPIRARASAPNSRVEHPATGE